MTNIYTVVEAVGSVGALGMMRDEWWKCSFRQDFRLI